MNLDLRSRSAPTARDLEHRAKAFVGYVVEKKKTMFT